MKGKYPVQCHHCEKFIGFQFGCRPLPDIYCYGCEAVVTHKEEMREEEMQRYRAALPR